MNLTKHAMERNPARPADEHMSTMPIWNRSMNAMPEVLPLDQATLDAAMPTIPDPKPNTKE
ncbi:MULTISPECIES: hypothetical protein [unclassified Mesorhizobium]|uniref:hypothetical protein n=1 Tax=unclassified Mesorhizobium TaxID=325217 RepID=UPI000FCA57AA|nr:MULTISPECIES: hypothetical protein [unclassified Mesorhizobium]RUX97437.1 hypothetical protein EN993_03810 [Mesorhizobium sp. M7D.F.Ca.US.004.01.2.1]RVA36623.1 hypothetical protein EN935_01620 [Mesorhizobium sp. M7D.F.Ca.US.004.03.1.1]